MKRSDLYFALLVVAIFAPFFIWSDVYQFYVGFNAAHPYITAFLKFVVLATLGESLGLRIKSGAYSERGFGFAPRAVVWGIFGVWIAAAMRTFAAGTPYLLESFGIPHVVEAMGGALTPTRVLGAFAISFMMNSCFAPVFMTAHKVTDTHILRCGGKLKALITPIPMREILSQLDWKVQWGFVFKKTLPLFWLPVHTITFLLPQQSQVLFAALLSVALGLLLSIAAVTARKRAAQQAGK